MSIKAEIDQAKLEKSMRHWSKRFGHTTAQTVCRWAVRTCAELAFETQVHGKNKSRGKQVGAIFRDATNVLFSAEKITTRGATSRVFMPSGDVFNIPNERILTSPEEINEWIEVNRTRRRRRTAKLPNDVKKFCTMAHFKKALAVRNARAGMAKGGWIGAGNDIAKAQNGERKETIGVNFFKYAQKHSHFGSAKRPSDGWRPYAGITNNVQHSRDALDKNGQKKAITHGLKKALKQYKFAVKALDKKT
jgi:hypothetical protein